MKPFSFHKSSAIFILMLLLFGWLAKQNSHAGDFSPATFKAGEDCRWVSSAAAELRFPAGDLYIARPDSQEKREQWLNTIRHYRQSLRGKSDTTQEQWVDMNFQGVRAWLRMENDWAKAYRLTPGQETVWQLEARWVVGNNELCAAFDFPTRESNVWGAWSTVRGAVKVPTDGQWHSLEIRVKVPDFDTGTLYARPMLGMDATHNPERGNIQIRNVKPSIINPTDGQKESLAGFRPSQPDKQGIDRSLYDEPSQHWLTGAWHVPAETDKEIGSILLRKVFDKQDKPKQG